MGLDTNCYILCDEETGVCAIIDPGDENEQIMKSAERAGCRPVGILLTHGHGAHTKGVQMLQRKYPGIPVYLCATEIHSYGIVFPALCDITHYADGDVLFIGTLAVHVLATPGHSPGSVTLRVKDVLFTGDTLLCGTCGSTDYYGANKEQLLDSLFKIGSLPGNYHIYPGHMDPSDLETERTSNSAMRSALKQMFLG